MKKMCYLLVLLLLQLFLFSSAIKNYSPQALTQVESMENRLQDGLTANAATDNQAVFYVGRRQYTANGYSYEMDAVPFIEKGRTLVPVRFLGLALGIPNEKIAWDSAYRKISLTGEDTVVTLTIGSYILYVNGEPQSMDVSPIMQNDRTYLPARCIAEAFGYNVTWQAEDKSVRIGKKTATPLTNTTNDGSTDTYDINTAAVEQALFAQINNDRVHMGLGRVEWDETAAKAARKHAAELAQNNYISHWNLQGKKPQQRYREAGGLYCTSENVGYAWFKGYSLNHDLVLKNALKIHADMMAEVPPEDGHRKNILEPHHTHVGVGLAYAVQEDGSITIAFTQEFTNHYVDLTGVPLTIMPGESFTITGKIQKTGVKPESIVLLWENAPTPMTVSMLKATHSYSSPNWDNMVSYALENWPQTYYPHTNASGSRFKIDNSGNITAALTAGKANGLNYLQVCLKDSQGKIFIANELVIVVHE